MHISNAVSGDPKVKSIPLFKTSFYRVSYIVKGDRFKTREVETLVTLTFMK